MTTATTSGKSVEEFVAWASRPENSDRQWELDEGEVIEVPPPRRTHGYYCWLVIAILTDYVNRRGSGHLLTNDAGIVVSRGPDTLRGADVMMFLRPAVASDFDAPYVEDVPDLIVEVVSPSDTSKRINRRINQYMTRGVRLVWVIDPDERTVTVCRPNEFPKVLDETDDLSGNGVLPDFSCPVRNLFVLPGPQPAPTQP
jgi:Uma2 family endonuclease